MCCDSLPANVIEARKRLLQPYDEEVTIWQTFTVHLLCETFFCNKTRSPSASSPRQTIVTAVADRGILCAIS